VPLHKETPIVSLEASSVPVFLGHGTQDDLVKFEFGQQGYRLLQEKGVPVDFKTYPMEHTVCEDELRDMASFLGKVLP
jgi:phospholipase/carboxylesterase